MGDLLHTSNKQEGNIQPYWSFPTDYPPTKPSLQACVSIRPTDEDGEYGM